MPALEKSCVSSHFFLSTTPGTCVEMHGSTRLHVFQYKAAALHKICIPWIAVHIWNNPTPATPIFDVRDKSFEIEAVDCAR
jgi:hypothetical protein